MKKHLLNELPWYELHSEIIAAVGSLFVTTDRRLTAAAAYVKYTSFADHPTAIRESISALQQIRCMNPNMIIFQDPLVQEILVREDTVKRSTFGIMTQPMWVGLETEFVEAAKMHHFDIVQLIDRNPLSPDPPESTRSTTNLSIPITVITARYFMPGGCTNICSVGVLHIPSKSINCTREVAKDEVDAIREPCQ